MADVRPLEDATEDVPAFTGQRRPHDHIRIHGCYECVLTPRADGNDSADAINTNLFRYSEWLDGEKLLRGDDESGDHRSHARLVTDFLAHQEARRG